MWTEKSKKEITELEKTNKAIPVSLWENEEKAKAYYHECQQVYTGFVKEYPTSALATPFQVFELMTN